MPKRRRKSRIKTGAIEPSLLKKAQEIIKQVKEKYENGYMDLRKNKKLREMNKARRQKEQEKKEEEKSKTGWPGLTQEDAQEIVEALEKAQPRPVVDLGNISVSKFFNTKEPIIATNMVFYGRFNVKEIYLPGLFSLWESESISFDYDPETAIHGAILKIPVSRNIQKIKEKLLKVGLWTKRLEKKLANSRVAMLLFANGKFIVSGAMSEDEAREAIRKVKKELLKYRKIKSSDIEVY